MIQNDSIVFAVSLLSVEINQLSQSVNMIDFHYIINPSHECDAIYRT